MRRFAHLDWPFLEPEHQTLAHEFEQWARTNISADHDSGVNDACRRLVRNFGSAGWLKHVVGGREFGGALDKIDARSLCVIRETLAYHSGLAEFSLAMQGLGSAAITL